MSVVVIQPSYGNPASRRRWAETLGEEIAFGRPPYFDLLSSGQREGLFRLHPSGRARFWGATPIHDKKMRKVELGDVFLFTGQNMVRGVGEVGLIFQNADFADALWRPDPGKDSWHNVYSLMRFQTVEIPYQEIWNLPGFNAGDNFMGLRVLEGEKAQVVLQGLNIDTTTSVRRDLAEEEEALAALSRHTKIVPVEGMHKTSTIYQQGARPVLVHRAEALLQNEYTQTLGQGLRVQRVRTPAGITDLYVSGPDGIELVEVKSGVSHKLVRDALGQLLDYAPHAPEPVDRLSGLFPGRVAPDDIRLLHGYGIDCIYRTEPGLFTRIPAPGEARAHMKKVWSGIFS